MLVIIEMILTYLFLHMFFFSIVLSTTEYLLHDIVCYVVGVFQI